MHVAHFGGVFHAIGELGGDHIAGVGGEDHVFIHQRIRFLKECALHVFLLDDAFHHAVHAGNRVFQDLVGRETRTGGVRLFLRQTTLCYAAGEIFVCPRVYVAQHGRHHVVHRRLYAVDGRAHRDLTTHTAAACYTKFFNFHYTHPFLIAPAISIFFNWSSV